MYLCVWIRTHICIYLYIHIHIHRNSAIASDASNSCCFLQYGRSVLMEATMKGYPEVAAKLIAAGVKIDLQCEVRERGMACRQCWRTVYVCVCACVSAYYIYLCTYMHVNIQIEKCVYVYVIFFICLHIPVYTYTFLCVCVYIKSCICNIYVLCVHI